MRALPSLRVLVALAGAESFSAAGASLGMSQSAVSQHLASLEKTVGMVLAQRGTRPVELTHAGQVLAEHGAAVHARMEAAHHDLDVLAGRQQQRLRLGGFPTALATIVPRSVARLRRDFPELSLTIVDDHAQGLVPRLLNRELDVAVVFEVPHGSSLASGELETTHLMTDAYRLIVPASHALTRTDNLLSLTDLADQAWIGGGPTSAWFQLVREACRRAGFEPRVALTSDDYLAVQAFVAAGLGIALVPGLAARRLIAGVRSLPVADPPTRAVVAACPSTRYRPAAATAMVATLHRVCRELR